MTTTTQQAAINEFVATLNELEATYTKELDRLSNVLLGQGYIVRSDFGLPINFDIVVGEDGLRRVANPRAGGNPARVVRFNRETAEQIAADCKDGAGNVAHAVHVTTALSEALADVRKNREAFAQFIA